MFVYSELLKYKISDLSDLARYLGLDNIGGLKKTELAQRIHDYYHLRPQEVPAQEVSNMSVRIRRIYEASKKE